MIAQRLFRACAAVLLCLAADHEVAGAQPSTAHDFVAGRAMNDIREQLKFTPRSLGRPGHEQEIGYIRQQLAAAGIGTVVLQTWTNFTIDGRTVPLTNIVARLNPGNPRRVLVGTHYDSIVQAYADPTDPNGPMPGANNSASGVAVLLETARALHGAQALPIGVDFVFFDGEEGVRSLGAGDPNWYALGSPYFVKHLRDTYPGALPKSAGIFDMVCFKNLQLHPEPTSFEQARSEVDHFWSIGHRIAPGVFLPSPSRDPIGDDQSALLGAGIPSFLVIDFDYAPWFNTTRDTPDKCSNSSLAAVGRTLVEYLREQK